MVEGRDQIQPLGCRDRLGSRSLLGRAGSAGEDDLATQPTNSLDLDSCRCFRHYDYGANSERLRAPRDRKAVIPTRGRDDPGLAPVTQPGYGGVRPAELEDSDRLQLLALEPESSPSERNFDQRGAVHDPRERAGRVPDVLQ
jgi:hypothetical protein